MGKASPGEPPGLRGSKRGKRSITLNISELEEWFKEDATQTDQEVYIHVKSADNIPISRRNRFLVAKYLKSITPNITKASFNFKGEMILKVKGVKEAEKLLKLTKICEWPVTAERHQKLNSSKGIVFNRDLCWLSEEEIKEGLAEYKVKEVYIFKRIPRIMENETNKEPRPYGLAVLTFDTIQPPQRIKFGFEYINVRRYIPNPMRCRKCQRLGHTAGNCKSKKMVCEHCGQGFEAESIPNHSCNIKMCVNCTVTGHSSNDRNCPRYLMEKEATAISVNESIDMRTARERLFSMYPTLEVFLKTRGKNLAQVVASANRETEITTAPTETEKTKERSCNSKSNNKETTQMAKACAHRRNAVDERDVQQFEKKSKQEEIKDKEIENIVSRNINVDSNIVNTNILKNKKSNIKLRSWRIGEKAVTYFLDNGIQEGIKPELDLSKFKGKRTESNAKILQVANKTINKDEVLKQVALEVRKKVNCNRIAIRVEKEKGKVTITALNAEEESSSEDHMSCDEENKD